MNKKLKFSISNKIKTYIIVLSTILVIFFPIYKIRYYYPHSEITKAHATNKIKIFKNYTTLSYVYYVGEKQTPYYLLVKYFYDDKVRKTLKIVYNKDNPGECILFNVDSIYFTTKVVFVFPVFLILIVLFAIDIENSKKKLDRNKDDFEDTEIL